MIHSDPCDGTVWLQLPHQLVRLAPAESPDQASFVAFSAPADAKGRSETLLCSAVSAAADAVRRRFAVATDAKVVKVFDLHDASSAEVASISCTKRPAFLLFVDAGASLLIADKGGDVIRLDVSSGSCEQILGHLAMLTSLDTVAAAGDCLLATGDADARIRVSRLPNAYNIEAFCLGHSGPVLGLSGCLPDCLVSLSADGTVRTWRARDGTELSQLRLDGHCRGGRIPCHLVVSERHRLAVCVAVATVDQDSGEDETDSGSVLLLCKIGPGPDCVLTLLSDAGIPHNNVGIPHDNVGIPHSNVGIPHSNVGIPHSNVGIPLSNVGISLGNGRVVACCLDRRTDRLLLLGDNPAAPIEARLIREDGPHLLSPSNSWRHATTVAMATAAAEAAKQRLGFYRDVLTYARLEASGYQDYLEGKEERIRRLKLKRKRAGAAAAAAAAGDISDDAEGDSVEPDRGDAS